MTLITAVALPQADGPPQLATVSFTVPPFTLMLRLLMSAQSAFFSTLLHEPPRSYL